MNAKVERRTLRKFEALIDECTRLEPVFDKNDKTPFTDGFVDLYKSHGRKKVDLQRRINVQIKGRSAHEVVPMFDMTRVDLEGYLRLEGLVFLVGIEKKSSKKVSPYYAVLDPFKIQRILDTFGPGQKQKSIALKKLPKKPEKVFAIFNAAKDMRKQNVLNDYANVFEEGISSITLTSAQRIKTGAPIRLSKLDDDYTLEVISSDGNRVFVNYDLELIPSSYVLHPAGFDVSGGNILFRNVQQRSLDDGLVETKLSDGLSLIFHRDRENAAINITGQSRLGDRLRDLEFLFSLKRGEEFRFGEDSTRVAIGVSESDEFLEAELRDLRMFAEVLEKFRVDLDLIELSEITQKQANQIRKLHGCLFEGDPATEDRDEPGRIRQPFAGMALELIRLKDAGDAVWRYEGLTNPESGMYMAQLSREDGTSRYIPVTPYDLIRPDSYPQTLNFRFDAMVGAYERIAEYEDTAWLANQMVLNLIRSADAALERTDEFLDAAESLNSWLMEREPESRVNQINEWQINKRRDEFTKEERESIRRMRRSASGGDEESLYSSISCSILLEDADETDSLVRELSCKQRETFEAYPIWNLYSNSKGIR